MKADSPDYYFKPGDWVKKKNFTKKKFEYDWTGPYMIHRIGFPGTYWIMKPDGTLSDSTVNQSDLAPFLAKTRPNRNFFVDVPEEDPDEDAESTDE